jgi:putative tricarboxylic transport membrane protein
VFPLVIGIGLVLCGALIAFGIGQSFEEPVVIEGDTIERPQHAWWRGFRVLVPPALLLLYVFASEPLGFIPVAALIALITCLTLGGSWRLAIPVAIVAPVFVHIVFAKLLRVPLPPGLLPMPW